MTSNAELTLAVQLEQAGIPFEREFRFAPPRRWRSDFAVQIRYMAQVPTGDLVEFNGGKLLVEIDGGAYVAGRHTRGAGFAADCEKQSAAAILGYRVIRATPSQVADGTALGWIKAALGMEVAA